MSAATRFPETTAAEPFAFALYATLPGKDGAHSIVVASTITAKALAGRTLEDLLDQRFGTMRLALLEQYRTAQEAE